MFILLKHFVKIQIIQILFETLSKLPKSGYIDLSGSTQRWLHSTISQKHSTLPYIFAANFN